MSSEFRALYQRRDELLSLAQDLKRRKFLVFIITNSSGKTEVLTKMAREKSRGIINVVICDALNWGWANQFADYRFIVPKDVNKEKYARLAHLLLKRMIRER